MLFCERKESNILEDNMKYSRERKWTFRILPFSFIYNVSHFVR